MRVAADHLHISELEFYDEYAYIWGHFQKSRLT